MALRRAKVAVSKRSRQVRRRFSWDLVSELTIYQIERLMEGKTTHPLRLQGRITDLLRKLGENHRKSDPFEIEQSLVRLPKEISPRISPDEQVDCKRNLERLLSQPTGISQRRLQNLTGIRVAPNRQGGNLDIPWKDIPHSRYKARALAKKICREKGMLGALSPRERLQRWLDLHPEEWPLMTHDDIGLQVGCSRELVCRHLCSLGVNRRKVRKWASNSN